MTAMHLAESAYDMPTGMLLHEAGRQFAMAEIVRDGWQQVLYERGAWYLLLVWAERTSGVPGTTTADTGEQVCNGCGAIGTRGEAHAGSCGVREAAIVQCPGCGEGVADGMACRRKRGHVRPPDCKASAPREGDPDGVTEPPEAQRERLIANGYKNDSRCSWLAIGRCAECGRIHDGKPSGVMVDGGCDGR
jgi:hypothetical protein